jgi:LmbE family N-acetylglucosaminyl deacetylase
MRYMAPELSTEPTLVTPATIPPGAGRTLLVVIAHADDAAIFVGGAIALWAAALWRVVILRVTDDRWDSVGLGEAETIERNSVELREAAAILDVAEVIDLGWPTDVLGDVSRVKLRERIIHTIRAQRPYGIVSFDPDSMFYEDNLDHRVTAQATDEAFWTAQFDKHHPEHFAAGLAPHGAVERWYFGRRILSVTHVFDTSSVADRQMEAIARHKTPLANLARQLELQARTAGVARPKIVDLAEAGDYRAFAAAVFGAAAAARGGPFGLLGPAEPLRLKRSPVLGA